MGGPIEDGLYISQRSGVRLLPDAECHAVSQVSWDMDTCTYVIPENRNWC